jgi:hypothetical protein
MSVRNLLLRGMVALWAMIAASDPPSTRPATSPVPAPTVIEFHNPADANFVLLHLPGVSGYMPVDRTLLAGLKLGLGTDRGLTARMTVLEWSNYDRGLGALMNERANRIQASRVAAAIVAARRAHPDLPIAITAHSGGAGVLLWALEQLPEGTQVDRIVLLAPAVSPNYDLSAALRRVRGECAVLSSPDDTVLKMTRAFGTLDRKYVTSAGVDGFVVPERYRDDPGEYRKLLPIPYRAEFVRYDNFGDHVGALSRAFARQILAPVITGENTRAHPPAPGVP